MDFSVTATHLSENGEALFSQSVESCVPVAARHFEGDQLHWYAVRTVPRHEKRIREYLGIREVSCFLPVYRAVRRWRNGRKVDVELPLFPGYLFVEIDLEYRMRVLEIPGVVSLVGAGRRPLPLPDSEIKALREGLRHHRCEPHAYLAVGQRVRIKMGPLASWTGILEYKKSGFRVVLTLDQIMRGVAVEVGATDIEIVPSRISGSERS